MTKAKPLPPVELLRQRFEYDPATGSLVWKRNGKQAGNAYKVGHSYYRRIMVDGQNYFAHRIAYAMHTGKDPLNMHIDHINGNGLNNSFFNLRLATPAQNLRNSKRPTSHTSGFKGVHKSKRSQRWIAQINVAGKLVYIGTFDSPELAHMAYCKAAAELHGEFARGA
jgi:hypothetical protein